MSLWLLSSTAAQQIRGPGGSRSQVPQAHSDVRSTGGLFRDPTPISSLSRFMRSQRGQQPTCDHLMHLSYQRKCEALASLDRQTPETAARHKGHCPGGRQFWVPLLSLTSPSYFHSSQAMLNLCF